MGDARGRPIPFLPKRGDRAPCEWSSQAAGRQPPMSEPRALRITSLRERIDRAQYHVDVDKVAEAMLGRPIGRLLIVPGAAIATDEDVDAADEVSDRGAASSEDVLEAA